ncbi:conjugative transposon protein [Enterococcus faecium]|uniref:Conjugative transposon protein n=1 Tax=Enterococcus faecium TaxID=1352 RepID=A0A242B0D9_ENTFC|nr:conjugative transposon protein [Enterococcus faecium]
MKKKLFRIVGMIAISLCAILLLLILIGTVAEATGLVDDTVKAGNLYSKYSLNNYQLDFLWIVHGIGCLGIGGMA